MSLKKVDTKGILGWWASNSVAANLVMIMTLIAGVVGYLRMDQVVFPAGEFNGLTISVAWPGAAPQEIEEQIVVRVEEVLADLEGIEELRSTAFEGSANINIEAKRSIDMDRFMDDVKLRVDSINNLPQSSYRPIVTRWRNDNIYMGASLHGNIDDLELKRLADQVRDEMALLPGASRAIVWGVLNEEVAIEVSEDALRRYGLTFDEVARAVRATSINTSSGSIRTQTGDVSVRARNLADTQRQFEQIVLRQTPEGAVVRVGDVGTVIDGFVDADLVSRYNGEPSAIIAIPTLEGAMNVVRTRDAVAGYIEGKNAELPGGVTLEMWWDDSKLYVDRMTMVFSNGVFGLFLVLIVLMLFLRPAVAFWATVGIAVAFAGTFAVLPMMGVSLNILSLFAFLIVIGIVVDDAIIVGENIHNQVERGYKGIDASVLGAQLVVKPVIFGVLTTMMAFAPWMLLSGPERQFTAQISFVVIAALTFSLIESLLILPNHLTHLKKQSETTGVFAPVLRFQRRFADALVWFAKSAYRPIAEIAVRKRYATVTLFVCLFVLSSMSLALGFVKYRFQPEVESDFLAITITMPEGTPFSRVVQVGEQLEAAERSFQESVNAQFDGEFELVLSTNMISENRQVQSWMNLAPPEVRPGGLSMREITERLRDELGPVPDAEEVNINYTFNDSDNAIRFSLQSRDLDALRVAGDDLKAQLASYSAVYDVRDNMQSATDEARITLKPGAESTGLTLQEVTRQVRQAFYGEEVQRLPRQGDDVRVMVRYPEAARESLDALRDFRIRTSEGREVPLATIADVEFAPGVTRINRLDRQRAVAITANIQGDESDRIRTDLNDTFFPAWERRHPEVFREVSGNAQDEQEFMGEVMMLLGIMLGLMYALLAIAFRSVFQPLLVMTAIPFGFVGALVGHLILGVPIGIFSYFGIGAAAGVVINDNLVLLDYVSRLRNAGVGAYQALIEAGVARFRPILLTSLTTFVGIAPMMFERSSQAQFLMPMIVALAFAVVFALFLTLFLVPALYAVGVDVARYVRWAIFGTPIQPLGSTWDPNPSTAGDMGIELGDEERQQPLMPGGAHPQPAE
jgi:multidrug efflux pump subunit AcrB